MTDMDAAERARAVWFMKRLRGEQYEPQEVEIKFVALDIRQAHEQGRQAGLEEAQTAARWAKLPHDYQWGADARQQFDFGKERAALAIRALKDKPEGGQ